MKLHTQIIARRKRCCSRWNKDKKKQSGANSNSFTSCSGEQREQEEDEQIVLTHPLYRDRKRFLKFVNSYACYGKMRLNESFETVC